MVKIKICVHPLPDPRHHAFSLLDALMKNYEMTTGLLKGRDMMKCYQDVPQVVQCELILQSNKLYIVFCIVFDCALLYLLTTVLLHLLQLFYSFFKSLIGKDVVVELKNDLRLDIINTFLTSYLCYVVLSYIKSACHLANWRIPDSSILAYARKPKTSVF